MDNLDPTAPQEHTMGEAKRIYSMMENDELGIEFSEFDNYVREALVNPNFEGTFDLEEMEDEKDNWDSENKASFDDDSEVSLFDSNEEDNE